jgi:hypothetical protein
MPFGASFLLLSTACAAGNCSKTRDGRNPQRGRLFDGLRLKCSKRERAGERPLKH